MTIFTPTPATVVQVVGVVGKMHIEPAIGLETRNPSIQVNPPRAPHTPDDNLSN